ncbi:MAG: hypothetical protein C3F13_16660 [Anaerolineales bacterium]|nr:hypothetical protein [Anaerolineae bacterium]PWB50583.1 MAG: hypothetical protein C3F13_16660 [Anaerolineales bacterium]
MKLHKGKSIFLLFSLAIIVSACAARTGTPGATLNPVSDPTQTPALLATPYAQQPAAGICASPDGQAVVITLNPDIPDPRCSKARPDQKLMVINRTQASLLVSIGKFEDLLPPGGQFTVDEPFGEYLAAGVHQLSVSPCCSAEIWLEEK